MPAYVFILEGFQMIIDDALLETDEEALKHGQELKTDFVLNKHGETVSVYRRLEEEKARPNLGQN